MCLIESSASSSPTVEKYYTEFASTYWEEEIPNAILESSAADDLSEPSSQTSRPLFWSREYEDKQFQPMKTASPRVEKEVHKLRTNLWKLSFKSRDCRIFPEKSMVVDFDKSGFCLHKNNDTVGKWRISPNGLTWQISSSEEVALYFSAETVLNPFGKHPRMLRGMVVRDRTASSWLPSKWLRPVVGTFTAVGIGEDLVDLTYEDRRIG